VKYVFVCFAVNPVIMAVSYFSFETNLGTANKVSNSAVTSVSKSCYNFLTNCY
jgi:hypothetical protein